jgi:nucleotide-binding universal stress UspA family protein
MKVLVPTDFSSTATSGLQYAKSFVANYGSGHIIVLHTVEKESERPAAEEKLAAFCNIDLPASITLTTAIAVGDFNEEIGKQAEAHGCALIVMATKGAHGIQKLVGSHAMKVVSQSNIPHIITQREVYDDEVLDRIAVPITLEREDKKILSTVAAIAKPLGAAVLLIYEDKEDEFLAATISRNLNFAKSFLRNAGVNTQAIDVGHDLSFDEAIVKYAAAHQCDLIATVNHHNDGILNLFGANFDQNLLENSAHIPILTVDARNHEQVNDIFMTTR